jgi:hypothetical protein
MIDQNEKHRGGDLIGEKMSDVEKLAYFRKKLATVETMLNEVLTHRNINLRERVLEGDASVYYGKLHSLREEEQVLYEEAFIGDDAHGSGTEWFQKVCEIEKLERDLIEGSKHPEAPVIRKMEALKEYKSYLDGKVEVLQDGMTLLNQSDNGYQSAAEIGRDLGVEPFDDKVLSEE